MSHQARRLVLGEQSMAVLGGRQARAQSDAKATGVDVSPDGYVFSADPDGARPLHPDSVTQAFERLCRRMEQPALCQLRKTKPTAKPSDLLPPRSGGRFGFMTSGTTRRPSSSLME
ncbi:MAG: hypothetical protein ACYCV7_01700 [Acidimicrobiales bacterium]